MKTLVSEYGKIKNPDIETMARLHAAFENIHPFQDGNGRTGRMILFKECLKNGIIPVIIRDEDKARYYSALHTAQVDRDFGPLTTYFKHEQDRYFEGIKESLWEWDVKDRESEVEPIMAHEFFEK